MDSNRVAQLEVDFKGRHPSTVHMLQLLYPNPNLPEGNSKQVADDIWTLAYNMVEALPDDPELTAALRKLWEAKNSLVWLCIFDEQINHVDYRDR